jgi:hypothetical protein
MEKEKRKGRPNRRGIRLAVVTLILASLCGAFSYYIYPGHSISDFSRFESPEEVVAFLHEPFDLYVTTSDEIRTFMAAYMPDNDTCQDSARRTLVSNDTEKQFVYIMTCYVPRWFALGGIMQGYRIRFWIRADETLEYIEADGYCSCP